MLENYQNKQLTKDDLLDKDKADLKETLAENDRKVSGTKVELAERLLNEDDSEAESEDETDTESTDKRRTYTFPAEGETITADNYQQALDKLNS